MSKAYSTKALPPGTILREWRLEEVLGVGGFGIVYKGCGIYFGELVAIKEYFPSSISERDEDDTVVPVDSDSEEVHALGLKKFVEEAKLLWNLSTPTRHPNIVSVRSLFEVHGTAYMVMDFEDGVSLSRMLKKGHRFNEASLSSLIKPIAEGLERAHRVGVLHRDIKPPNILINEDGRPVLIDFGSARFESGEATSTTVTFHTPPYAAIEQYVKTYDQGPWTDIYALGVVLYECVTGKKPAEVLERLHGGEDSRLVDGNWPGYSKTFLAAIDAAMTIKPANRPQSIAAWLALFEGTSASADAVDDDDATRIVAYSELPKEIVPVAPNLPGFSSDEKPPTNVPSDPKQVRFKISSQEPSTGDKSEPAALGPKPGDQASEGANKPPARAHSKPAKGEIAHDPGKTAATEAGEAPKKRLNPFVIGGAVLALATIGGSWLIFGGHRPAATGPASIAPQVPSVAASSSPIGDDFTAVLKALLSDARRSGAPATLIEQLALATGESKWRATAPPPDSSAEAGSGATALVPPISGTAAAAAAAMFTKGLVADAESRARQLTASVPWAVIAGTARKEPANRQTIARSVRASLQSLRIAGQAAEKASTPSEVLSAAQQALSSWREFTSGAQLAYRAKKSPSPTSAATEAPIQFTEKASAAPPSVISSASAMSAKMGQIETVIARTRQLIRQMDQLPSGTKPDSRGTDKEKSIYASRQADKKAAQEYGRYIDRLASSARGAKTDADVDRLLRQALQTEDYLRAMLNRTRA